MINACMEGRRYGETTPRSEDESYMIFNDEELLKLRSEVQFILDRDAPWQLDSWGSVDEFIDHVNADLLSPVETAVRENRWLYGCWC